MDDAIAMQEPFFKALLTPHRSLGRSGFGLIMGALVFGWIVTGAICLSLGAWPVFGFFGLDVIGVYVAFKLNYRAARAREEVAVSRTSVDIRKVAPSGRAQEHHFNPFWSRLLVNRHPDIGVTRMILESRGARVPVGTFLNPDDRESFSAAFSQALAKAKGR